MGAKSWVRYAAVKRQQVHAQKGYNKEQDNNGYIKAEMTFRGNDLIENLALRTTVTEKLVSEGLYKLQLHLLKPYRTITSLFY